jgi:hypothetical protein
LPCAGSSGCASLATTGFGRVDRVGAVRRVVRADWVLALDDDGGFERVTMRERALAFSSLRTAVRVVRVTRRVWVADSVSERREREKRETHGYVRGHVSVNGKKDRRETKTSPPALGSIHSFNHNKHAQTPKRARDRARDRRLIRLD